MIYKHTDEVFLEHSLRILEKTLGYSSVRDHRKYYSIVAKDGRKYLVLYSSRYSRRSRPYRTFSLNPVAVLEALALGTVNTFRKAFLLLGYGLIIGIEDHVIYGSCLLGYYRMRGAGIYDAGLCMGSQEHIELMVRELGLDLVIMPYAPSMGCERVEEHKRMIYAERGRKVFYQKLYYCYLHS